MSFFKGMDPKNKGKILEYTGKEKIELATKKLMGITNEGKYLMVDKLNIEESKTMPNSAAYEDAYQNNNYLVSGKVWYKTFDVVLDKIMPAKVSSFKIEFCDTRDSLGLPDISMTNLTLE